MHASTAATVLCVVATDLSMTAHARRMETAPNAHWPCETANGYRLFSMMSDSKTSATKRRAVGTYMYDCGYFDTDEFKIAEQRLEAFPKPQWQTRLCTEDGDPEELHVHYRDPVVLVAGILRNPRLDHTRTVWGPEVCKDDESGRDGYFSDVCHGLWWKAMQAACNPGVVLLTIILTQDEAQVDENGRKSLTPVYATTANVRAEDRNQPWARVLVGYLQKPNKNLKPADMGHEEWKRRKRLLKVRQMDAMLESVARLGRTGVKMVVRDRFGELVTATVVPTVAFASYDQPEISSVTGCKGNYQGMPMFCHRYDPARLLLRGHSRNATVATVNGTRWPVRVAARSDPTLATFQWRALDGYSTVATGSRPLLP